MKKVPTAVRSIANEHLLCKSSAKDAQIGLEAALQMSGGTIMRKDSSENGIFGGEAETDRPHSQPYGNYHCQNRCSASGGISKTSKSERHHEELL